LTGKYRSEADLAKSARGQGVKKYLNDRGDRILEALDEVAGRYASTPVRVAVAWLLTRPVVTAPIASATSLAQLDDLIAGTRLELDEAAIGLLDAASA
jgi:aryl-alcohol dehydrogenase-like predicted oxidoreductase